MTQRELKNMVKSNVAKDITYLSFSDIEKLRDTENLRTISVSYGTYGMNGGLFQGKSGTLYAITSRSTSLFQLA